MLVPSATKRRKNQTKAHVRFAAIIATDGIILTVFVHTAKTFICSYCKNFFQIQLLNYILVLSPDSTPKNGKGLVTLLAFLGCADSAMTLQLPRKTY